MGKINVLLAVALGTAAVLAGSRSENKEAFSIQTTPAAGYHNGCGSWGQYLDSDGWDLSYYHYGTSSGSASARITVKNPGRVAFKLNLRSEVAASCSVSRDGSKLFSSPASESWSGGYCWTRFTTNVVLHLDRPNTVLEVRCSVPSSPSYYYSDSRCSISDLSFTPPDSRYYFDRSAFTPTTWKMRNYRNSSAAWFEQGDTVYRGDMALRSGKVADGQTSWIETTVVGPGSMAFTWKTSSQKDRDNLAVYLDGARKTAISGETDWLDASVAVPAGEHVIRWSYEKDASGSSGQDCAWIGMIYWQTSLRRWVEDILATGAVRTGVWDGFRKEFDSRLAVNPKDYEARILRAATYLAELSEMPEVARLLQAYGLTFSLASGSVTGTPTVDGAPLPNEAVDRVAAIALPAIQRMEDELALIPDAWDGSFTVHAADYPLDEDVCFDRADLLFLKAMLQVTRAAILYAQGQDFALDYSQVQNEVAQYQKDFPDLSAAPVVDGSDAEWSGVRETFTDRSGVLAKIKTGAFAQKAYVSFMFADAVKPFAQDEDFPHFHFSAVKVLGHKNADFCFSPKFEDGKLEQVSEKGWDVSSFRRGRFVEMSVMPPPGFQVVRVSPEAYAERFCTVKPSSSGAIKADGAVNDWADIPVCISGAHGKGAGRLHLSGRDLSFLVEFANYDAGTKGELRRFSLAFERDGAAGRVRYSFYNKGDCSVPGEAELYFGNSQSSVPFSAAVKGNALEVKMSLPSRICDGSPLDVRDLSCSVYSATQGSASFSWGMLESYTRLLRKRVPFSQILQESPAFLKRARSVKNLADSKTAVQRALEFMGVADGIISARRDGRMHFFDYDPSLALDQKKARELVADGKASLESAVRHSYGADMDWLVERGYMRKEKLDQVKADSAYGTGTDSLFLGALFSGKFTRDLLPALSMADRPVLSSLPDASFGGLVQSATTERIVKSCEGRVEFAQVFVGDRWPETLPVGCRRPVWMVRYVKGGGKVTYRANMSSALSAALFCYVDGELQPVTTFSGDDVVVSVDLGADGEHEISWCFVPYAAQYFDFTPVLDIRGAIKDFNYFAPGIPEDGGPSSGTDAPTPGGTDPGSNPGGNPGGKPDSNPGGGSGGESADPGNSSGTSDPTRGPQLFAGADTDDFAGGETYLGWLRDAAGKIAGTIEVKCAAARAGSASKVSGTLFRLATGKKERLAAERVLPGADAAYLGMELHGRTLGGAYDGYTVVAARDGLSSKDRDVKKAATAAVAAKAGVWTFALKLAQGYAGFTATVDKRGKCKLAGQLPDGTRVSLTAKGVLGDGRLAFPFVMSKKTTLGFVLWVSDDGTATITDLADIRLATGESITARVVPPSSEHALPDGGYTFSDGTVRQAFSVVRGKWNAGKKDENPVNLKLTFTARTGAVKGSYQIVDGKTKSRYTVSGVVVGTGFYGSSLLKKVGSKSVWTE